MDLFSRRARAAEGSAARATTIDQVVKLKEQLDRESSLSAEPSPSRAKLSPGLAPSVDLLAEVAMNELPLTVPGTKLNAALLTPSRRVVSVMAPDLSQAGTTPAPSFFVNTGPIAADITSGSVFEALGKHGWLPALEHSGPLSAAAAAAANSPLRKIMGSQQQHQAQAAAVATGAFMVGTGAAVVGAITASFALWIATGKPSPSGLRDMVAQRNTSRRERLEAGAVGTTTVAIGAAAERSVKTSSVVRDLAPQLKRQFGVAAAPKS